LYSPGDQLTLLYIFHPGIRDSQRERMLAARSIIYSKIVLKEEVTDDLDTFPHLRDELGCIRIIKQLSLDDCRRLFPMVRREKTSEAREIVAEYRAELMPQIDTDYQHITNQFYKLNKMMERLQEIDKYNQVKPYQHQIDEILKRFDPQS